MQAPGYPEVMGWHHVFGDENGSHHGGAHRSLAGGVLTQDGLRNDQIYDFYEMPRPINPGPGEVFLARWCVFVDPRSGPYDTGVVIARDNPGGAVFLGIGPTALRIGPFEVAIPLTPGAFHSFCLQSPDMRAYSISIDGVWAYAGHFQDSNLDSFVNFGDGVQGQVSLSKWRYFAFGVIPEPGTCFLLLLVSCMARGSRTRRPW